MIYRSPYPDVEIPDLPLASFVLRHAERLATKPALIDGPSGRALTYGELADGVRRVASGLAQDYLAWSSTVGATVAVDLPDGSTLEGVAEAVDWDGRLVVATAQGRTELATGDVRHVRTGGAEA